MIKPSPKTYHVKSFGCQMNIYDGDRMSELLSREGLVATMERDAELVVLNTCHIRERAVHRVYSEIGTLKRADGSTPMIAVAGCVAQAEGAEVSRRARDVDIVVGPQAYHRLPQLVALASAGLAAIDTDMPVETKFAALPTRGAQRPTAFLTVQEGCDKFCTYCVVPYTRGAEVSRSFDALLEEAKSLVAGGAREITLLGQNVNAWQHEGRGLHDVIESLDALSGLERIRYTTSHPNDMTQALIEAHGSVGKLMPYLHLPVQSGSDRVLKAMNRSHTRDTYLRLLDRVRAVRPDIALSGDFIVGFPGETDADFEATISLVAEVGYAQAYSFSYSSRPGTPAATMNAQVPKVVMDERLQRLQSAINAQQSAFNARSVGIGTQILIERRGKLPGQFIGKSPWLQSVHVIGRDIGIGDLLDVTIVAAGPNSVTGEIPMPVSMPTIAAMNAA